MALLALGGGCGRLAVSHPAHVSRRTAVVATLSPPKRDKVDYWVDATSSFFEADSRPIMLYDGVCNLCNGGVKFVRDNDKNRRIRYEALQSESGKKLLRRSGRAPDDISSVVLVEKDRSYIKSNAVLKIMEYIDLPFPQLAFFLQFVPQFVRDFAYDNIAINRYNIFGRSDSSMYFLLTYPYWGRRNRINPRRTPDTNPPICAKLSTPSTPVQRVHRMLQLKQFLSFLHGEDKIKGFHQTQKADTETVTNKHKACHVDNQMNDSSMKPHARQKAILLIFRHN